MVCTGSATRSLRRIAQTELSLGLFQRMTEKAGAAADRGGMGLKILLGLMAAAILIALLVAKWNRDAVTVHYQTTLEVEVDGAVHIGSGVMSMRLVETRQSWGTTGIGFQVAGEAIPVDLGDGRFLYLSMSGGDAVWIEGWNDHASHVMTHWKFLMVAFRGHSVRGFAPMFRHWKQERPVVDVPLLILPKLYLSADPDDPASFRFVKPDSLPAMGIRIQRVTVAITDIPVTRGRIAGHLPWLDGFDRIGSMYRFDFTR